MGHRDEAVSECVGGLKAQSRTFFINHRKKFRPKPFLPKSRA